MREKRSEYKRERSTQQRGEEWMQRQFERVESIERMQNEIHTPTSKQESPLRKYLRSPNNQQARPRTSYQNQSFSSVKKGAISDIEGMEKFFCQSVNAPLTYDHGRKEQPSLSDLLDDDIQIRQL